MAQDNEIDLILDILGMDDPLEGLDGVDCFQAHETIADNQQAKLPTSELPHHLLSETTTLASDTPCMSPTA